MYRDCAKPPIFLLINALRGFDFDSPALYHPPAMAPQITESKSPRQWAEIGQAIDFQEKIKVFPKLFDSLAGGLTALDESTEPGDWAGKPVIGTTRFTFLDSTSGLVVAHLAARVDAPAVCQRCLGLLSVTLETDEQYLLVAEGERVARDDYERWDYEGDRIRPLDIVDETLVMALPFAAKHAAAENCTAPFAADPPAAKQTVRPFAGLKSVLEGQAVGSSKAEDD